MLNEAEIHLRKTLVRSILDNGGCSPLEADSDLNDASRAVVVAMHTEHGSAWLGKINLYDKERHGGHPIMWLYGGDHYCASCSSDGWLVYNFGASFVAPAYDAELVRLIAERDDAKYTGTRDDAERVKVIFERLEAIGGTHLTWS